MSVYKKNEKKIENFVFNQFTTQKDANKEVEVFNFKQIDPNKIVENKLTKSIIREERNFAKKSGFQISKVVKKHRGAAEQEEQDLQKIVDDKLSLKYEEVSKSAYEEGIERGLVEGKQEALEKTLLDLEEKVQGVEQMLLDLNRKKEEILENSKKDATQLIKSLTKWICLKEIDLERSEYYESLLSSLITEVNSRNNLLLKVSSDIYESMPDIISSVEKKIGKLPNIKYAISPEVLEKGMILESENGIIDATIETQFKMMDELFSKEGQ